MKNDVTKTELLNLLQSERNQLKEVLTKVNDKRMEIPDVQGKWSIKVIIAHITFWERRGTDWVKSILKEETPQIGFLTKQGYDVRAEMKKINQEIYLKNKDRPLKDIFEEFEETFPKLIEQVQALTEDQLKNVYHPEWDSTNQVTTRDIVAWRFYHYRSHMEHIKTWLEKIESKLNTKNT
ncbi:MAG: ClbS/DfsB family four-helix bundle protein [Candidatus Hodarchaeales archaeon]|jgi:hypothetical protein